MLKAFRPEASRVQCWNVTGKRHRTSAALDDCHPERQRRTCFSEPWNLLL